VRERAKVLSLSGGSSRSRGRRYMIASHLCQAARSRRLRLPQLRRLSCQAGRRAYEIARSAQPMSVRLKAASKPRRSAD